MLKTSLPECKGCPITVLALPVIVTQSVGSSNDPALCCCVILPVCIYSLLPIEFGVFFWCSLTLATLPPALSRFCFEVFSFSFQFVLFYLLWLCTAKCNNLTAFVCFTIRCMDQFGCHSPDTRRYDLPTQVSANPMGQNYSRIISAKKASTCTNKFSTFWPACQFCCRLLAFCPKVMYHVWSVHTATLKGI